MSDEQPVLRSPFLVVWTAALSVVTFVVVLAASQPWTRPPAADPARIVAAAQEAADRDAAKEAAIVHVAVIGDSYTGGSKMGGAKPGTNWVTHVDTALAAKGIQIRWRVKGAGGSGYVATGQEDARFEQLVPKVVEGDTDLLVVFGSRNDAGRGGVRDRAAATYAAAAVISPGIRMLVIGPPWVNGDAPASIRATRDEVRSAAEAARAIFVDPLAEGWFSGQDAGLIGSDGTHPTDEGHAYMARKIESEMANALSPGGE